MIVKTNETLWNKIFLFQLDDPTSSIKFSDKLATENGWSSDFASQAILEYKKFIFLCCISPSGASPSQVVDEVWHLHLTYTQNYWKDFCANTLEKEIHHHPSKGGHAEKARHQQWYAQTLLLYRDVFGENPPVAIWPPAQSISFNPGFGEDLPRLSYLDVYKKNLYILLLPFLFPFLFGKIHPLQLTGPQFLWFYGFLLAATIGFLLMVRKQKRNLLAQVVDESPVQTRNWFAIARFVFGKNRAIQSAIVDLVSKGILVAEPTDRFRFYPEKMDTDTLATNPLASNLLHLHLPDQLLRMKDLPDFYNEDLTFDAALAALYRRVTRKDYTAFITSILVMLFGFIRIRQGQANGYPVTYLTMMVLLGGFLLLVLSAILSTSGLFHDAFTERYKQTETPDPKAEPILSRFVLFGVAALAGSYAFANLENTFRSHRTDGGDSATSSSSCGSSGCGSSCGGGGCGGCGGGD